MKSRFLFFFFLTFFSSNLWCEWEILQNKEYAFHRKDTEIKEVELDDGFSDIELSSYLYFFEDINHNKSPYDLISSKTYTEKFIESGKSPNFGYSNHKYWSYFRLRDKRFKKDDVILVFDYPLIDYIDLNCIKEDGSKYLKKSGDHLSIMEWEIKYRKPSFKIENNTKECWVSASSSSSLQLPLLLYSEDFFHETRIHDITIQSIYFGGLLAILIYNVLLTISTRIYSYLIYCFFLLFYGLFQLFISGIGYVYFWPFQPTDLLDKTVPFFLSLVTLASYLFFISLLDLKKNHLKLYKLIKYIIMIQSFHPVLVILFNYKYGIFSIFLLGPLCTVTVIISSIYLSIKGEKIAKYYLLAWSILIIGTIISMLTTIGILNRNLFTINVQQIGSVIEFTLLSVVLGYKLNLIQKEISKNLEEEVNKRTSELEIQKNRLENIQNFTRMIQNASDFNVMAENIKKTFLENFNLSYYHFYLCRFPKKLIELIRIESDKNLPENVLNELKYNSIPFEEKNSFHNAVMTYGKPIYLKNAKRGNLSPSENKNREVLGITSIYIIPLINSGKVFGLLSFADIKSELQSEQNLHKLSPTQREDIELLCQSIANGLYQSIQKKELEDQKKSIEDLNIFVKNLNESHDIKSIFNKIKIHLNNNYNIEHIGLGIVDKSENFAKFIESSLFELEGFNNFFSNIEVPIKNVVGAHAYTFKANKSFYIRKISLNRATKEEIEIFNVVKFKTFLILPLILNGKNIGFLDLANINNNSILSRDQINQLSILAEQLAGIIHSSNLYKELDSTLTELRDTQVQLVEAEKSAALGQLISGVAHEINNPLAAIRSSAEVLEMDQDTILDEMPRFFQNSNSQTIDTFLELQKISDKNRKSITSKEERQRKKNVLKSLEKEPFSSEILKENIAEYLSELWIEDYLPKLRQNYSEVEILQLLRFLSLFNTQKNSLKNIKLSTEKSARIIFSLRKFLKTDIRGTPREATLEDLLESSLRVYDNYLRGIVNVEREIGVNLSIVCVVDEIQQVFKNLIFNAVQAMYSSETKILKIKMESIRENDKSIIRIEFQDSGHGISSDIQHNLFTPFFTTKSRGEGIGLGLYVSRIILEEHGGSLRYQAKNNGSIFIIDFPISS